MHTAANTHELVFRLPTGQEWTTRVGYWMQHASAKHRFTLSGIGVCSVQDQSGEEHRALSKPNDLEDRIGNVFHITGERLGCQALVYGDTVIEPLPVRLPKKRRRTSTPPRPR